MAKIVNANGEVKEVRLKMLNIPPSTARRRGWTFPPGAKVIIGKVKVESVIMSHHFDRTIPYRDTGKRPCDVRRRA